MTCFKILVSYIPYGFHPRKARSLESKRVQSIVISILHSILSQFLHESIVQINPTLIGTLKIKAQQPCTFYDPPQTDLFM